jgi:hypothetical protein
MKNHRIIATAVGLLAGIAGIVPGTTATSFAKTTKTTRIVLGSRASAPDGKGWGTTAPTTIFNGGDPSGLVTHVHWQNWGKSTATGWGLTSIYKPTGGYYSKLVKVELRATDIARNTQTGAREYMRLQAKEPSRPGGPLGSWFEWVAQTEMCN